jgi:RIO-like serine/threonine protein kinase
MAESLREKIHRAVIDIHQSGETVTRERIANVVGIKPSVVDDNMKRLVDDELLVRVTRGVYAPARVYPEDRPVSITTMSDGSVKLEVGDQVLELTPREARHVAMSTAGFTLRFGF